MEYIYTLILTFNNGVEHIDVTTKQECEYIGNRWVNSTSNYRNPFYLCVKRTNLKKDK